jgi:hypothetical protein
MNRFYRVLGHILARSRTGRSARRARAFWSPIAAGFAVLFGATLWAASAEALPSFAQQTGQPCAQCHVGAFGPQLTVYGREFKEFGYVNGDGRNNLPPVAALFTGSYTRTDADRRAIAGYHTNDNLVGQSAVFAYAGRLPLKIGAFAEVAYDAIHRTFSIANVDIKRAFLTEAFGKDLLVGADVNDRPGVQDPWNSTPAFEFNTSTSPFAGSPSNAVLMDGKLAGRVAGAGAYAMWNNALYGEITAYRPLNDEQLGHVGLARAPTADRYDGVGPYWRLALQHQFGDLHYAEIGGYGVSATRFPSDKTLAGVDKLTDTGLDATYQYSGKPNRFVAHATWIHENDDLDASVFLNHTAAQDHLDVYRADAIYSYDNTWTPALEVFRIDGSRDAKFFKTSSGLPDSSGYVLEVSYTPWGKSSSPVIWANTRFTARWIGYSEFNGTRAGASANNTFYLSAKVGIAPFGALISR